DINADRNREESIIKYQRLLASAFKKYATIKISMNLFTMYEMSEEISMDRREEIEGYIDMINLALRSVYLDRSLSDPSIIEEIKNIRDTITGKMRILTAYTDALEIYEYIVNRCEPKILDIVDEDIDIDTLAKDMYDFVFSDDDKIVINTKIQDFIGQLPVRMTKQRFYDIISNSLAIYRGGEQSALDDFVESIRDTALINFKTADLEQYPQLKEIYNTLKYTDYKNLDRKSLDAANDMITDASTIIKESVTDYLMLTEIINDTLIVLYTDSLSSEKYMTEEDEIAGQIICEIIQADDIYQASDKFDKLFLKLEGVQEEDYEILSKLEVNLDDLYNVYYDMYETGTIRESFEKLYKADMLTSTSLYMDIDSSTPDIKVVAEEVDEIYINESKNSLIEDFDKLFEKLGKQEKRSVMAKVLAQMPVFFNSRDEILEYFKYALSSCTDKGELTAFRDIAGDMML
nr:hypothetical protein [Eubacterium sp.]